ncbi:hypothetical protein DWX59_23650 [Enterocloster aldenensis]|uniref:hypothetical protein n=1 Tax=Enterocloster aldenensis TaxID=358742 RepID=UPI000E3FF132|nr:hypothetical protein DWX59_23650 [Enterocloster aldenensis]
MTKTTELAIRAKAAIRYPGWRLDIVGPTTAVLTNMMGRRRILIVRRRRNRRDGPWMRLARWIANFLRRCARQIVDATEWIVPAVIWLLGMWMAAMVVMALAMGVEL